jgi:hypothetical protein
MANPAGYRTWNTADTVSAADFSTYLQDQVVGVYTDSSNRSSELAAPAEGQVSMTKDDNVLAIYDGSAWVNVLDIDTISVSGGNYTMTGTLTLGSGGTAITLPNTDGTSGQILSTNGSGTVSWIANDEGDITGVTAGSGLAGGGTAGTVTVTIDFDTKGDILVASAADTAEKVPIGTDGQALVADSSTTSGIAWATKTSTATFMFSKVGDLAVASGKGRLKVPTAITIVDVTATCDTAPAGANAIFNVHKNGTTIFTTQANRPTVAAGSQDGSAATPNVTTVAAGDVLTVDIDQIGSSTAGADATVIIRYTAAV